MYISHLKSSLVSITDNPNYILDVIQDFMAQHAGQNQL